MYCSNCGSKCEDKDLFCKACGNKIKRKKEIINNKEISIDEPLDKIYIGDNYEKIKKERFSPPAFFFGINYLIYRKLWFYALLWLGLLITSEILIDEYSYIVLFGLHIALGIFFNKLYVIYVNKKVEKIKLKQNSSEDVRKTCKKKGGTSVGALIGLYAILLTIFTIFIFVVFVFELGKELDKEFNFTKTEEQLKDTFELEDLSYIPPSGYKLENYNKETSKTYTSNKQGSYCSFKIDRVIAYTDNTEEDYFKNNIYVSIDDNVSQIGTKTINNRDWKYIIIDNNSKTSYYYAILFNDKIYTVQYSIYKDNNNCQLDYEKFITTLRLDNNNLITS